MRLKNNIIVDFNLYHNQMSELELLRELALGLRFGDISFNEFVDELSKANKKYEWWI